METGNSQVQSVDDTQEAAGLDATRDSDGDKSEHSEDLCRYCFGPFEEDEDDPKISPCSCRGGQQFCHLSCLRQWQRSVLVTQPTHPAFYERDERQFVCNVCNAAFNVHPPTRSEMMKQFTGPELAALLEVGCLIVTEPKTSKYMANVLLHNSHIPTVQDMRHWVEGVYLIIHVEEDSASDGEDLIVAVNLARPTRIPQGIVDQCKHICASSSASVGRTVTLTGLQRTEFNGREGTVIGRAPHTGRIQVQLSDTDEHKGKKMALKYENLELAGENPPEADVSAYIGGPCQPQNPTAVAVLQATHPDELAKYCCRQGGNQGGLWVSGDLDDVCAIARADAARCGASAAPVDAFWGDARWSRTQLLGEIARGSWGVCRAEVNDVIRKVSGAYEHGQDGAMDTADDSNDAGEDTPLSSHIPWKVLIDCGRLIYAAKSEMTDEDIHREDDAMTAEQEDEAARALNERMQETRQRLRAQLLAQQEARDRENQTTESADTDILNVSDVPAEDGARDAAASSHEESEQGAEDVE
eukprot:m.1197789 g.1197789  ORF g.1197789 m.1197789 type:complete len:527 (-) comp24569_c0_seq1:2931-4511(-)